MYVSYMAEAQDRRAEAMGLVYTLGNCQISEVSVILV